MLCVILLIKNFRFGAMMSSTSLRNRHVVEYPKVLKNHNPLFANHMNSATVIQFQI
jgi:hypothetical protein